MKATVPYIEQKFEGPNRQMFGGKLPKIPVELSDDGVPRSVEHCRDIRWWSPEVGRALPKSRLLRKIERGDRNIYNDYIAFCRWHGRQVKSIKFRRQVEYDLFFMR